MYVLSKLVDVGKRGYKWTDYIGSWTSLAGYDGILFFGARALEGSFEIWHCDAPIAEITSSVGRVSGMSDYYLTAVSNIQ